MIALHKNASGLHKAEYGPRAVQAQAAQLTC